MIKPTPNPPDEIPTPDNTSPYESADSKRLHEAAERALDHYLNPPRNPDAKRKRGPMYAIDPDYTSEELLANVSETLGSAKTISLDFAGMLPPPHRRTLLGIAQLVMLSELAVNRVLDTMELTG
ncbi:hypothetical protein N8H74_26530 [Pseudomonas sp. B2M1-30]|uniref:DUF6124 family protein n=1 Tax=Pseudomonas TaxID=286 RepID=UPI0021C5C830|nr:MULTISPECIES: hypothetical protein [Pseudomonas]MCU0121829.1 hypothetical protein [Pseudomonas sp. B2M1-30]MCU7264479.1 hypothetical protein [Pseudomonas koreensis]